MTKYDYYKAVHEAAKEWIALEVDLSEFDDAKELNDYLSDVLFIEDSVTGNASGSFTFSAWEAEENLVHNMDLLEEAADDLGYSWADLFPAGWDPEAADVLIRIHILPCVINDLCDELEEGGAWGE